MKKLFTLLLAGLLFVSPVFGQEDRKLKVVIDRFELGQNSSDDADIIEAAQSPNLQNVEIKKKGKVYKRKGQALFANDVSNNAWTGLGIFEPDQNTNLIMAASGVSVVSSNTAEDNWTIRNSGHNLTTGQDTEFIQANKRVFIINGSNNTANWNGTVWDPGSSSTASAPIATTGTWRLNYLFLAGNPTNRDWIYFSNNLAPLTFTPTDILKVNTGDGQKITKLEDFREFEIIAYKEKSVFIVNIESTTVPGGWTIQPITKAVGCIAPRSVVNVGNDHWFLSSTPIAVRSLVRTSFDKILTEMRSQPIQDIFDGTGSTVINETVISKACAILFDDKYILAIATGTSTVNNLVVVYDFITKSWLTIDGWYPSSWVKFNNKLYYTDANDGRVIHCFTGTQGDMTKGPVTTGATEPQKAITYTYVTKNIDFDNAENYKQPNAIEFEFKPVGGYTATVYIELDDGGFQEIGTVSLSSGAPTLPINLPFNLTASGMVLKTFQIQQYGEFRKIKVKVVQSGLSELCVLKRVAIFADIKQWRRE